MPRRKVVKTFDSSEVQGEGAWVKFKAMSIGEVRQVQAAIDQEGNIDFSLRTLQEKFIDWNWADENGDPLPSPLKDDAVLEDLTPEEFNFLCRCVVGAEGSRKN